MNVKIEERMRKIHFKALHLLFVPFVLFTNKHLNGTRSDCSSSFMVLKNHCLWISDCNCIHFLGFGFNDF